MKSSFKCYFQLFFLVLTFLSTGFVCAQSTKEDVTQQIVENQWDTREVSEGIIWKYMHFDALFKSKQSITLLEVDLQDVEIQIPYVERGFIKTSQAGSQLKAAAAINGSFFDTEIGGATVFLKIDNKLINVTRDGFNPYRENAGFVLDQSSIDVIRKPAEGWNSLDQYASVLVSGPMLISEGRLLDQIAEPFNLNRHPRTAIGITADDKLIAAIIDGRNSNAHGMTIPELAQLMESLGCVKAMNLDGGGSSTGWVRDFGVVNYPSDNKQFDHHGEREVANVIVFM